MSGGLVESLKDCSDSILGIRDDIGAALKPVFFVIRTWSGSEVGEGNAADAETRLELSPHIVDLSLNFRALESGVVKQGDILLKGVSKNKYPDRSTFESTSQSKSVEKFFRVGELLYQSIAVRERYLTWNVQLRPLSDQRRF